MKILFTGVYSHLHGGLEKFAERVRTALEAEGHTVDTVGDPPAEAGEYDYVLMHKIPPTLAALQRLRQQCGERLHFYAHDHETYCLRRHYYDPFKRNCERMYSFFPCRFCAAVTRPSWVLRALTRDILGFQRELAKVKTFAPSTYTRGRLLACGFAPERVRVVHPYFGDFQATPREYLPEGKLRILFLGQLVAGKGADLLIRALGRMKKPATLTIIGTGRDEAELRKLATACFSGVGQPVVNFLGWQEQAERFFAEADVSCMPSRWNEPFGMVGPEGMARGVPSVTFRVGGTVDWLKEGESGFFAEAQTPEALAEALDRCADRETLSRLGKSSFALAQRLFDRQQFLRKLLAN